MKLLLPASFSYTRHRKPKAEAKRAGASQVWSFGGLEDTSNTLSTVPGLGTLRTQKLVRGSFPVLGSGACWTDAELVLFAMPRSLLAMCFLYCHGRHVHLAGALVTTHDQLSVSQASDVGQCTALGVRAALRSCYREMGVCSLLVASPCFHACSRKSCRRGAAEGGCCT